MSYQVYLNSASSTDVYPDNTNTSFRVQLPVSLDTRGYKCALSEICFVNDVLSVPESNYISTTKVRETTKSVGVDCRADDDLEARVIGAFDGKLHYEDNGYFATFEEPTRVVLNSKLEGILGKVVSTLDRVIYFDKMPRVSESTGEKNYLKMRWHHYHHLWYRIPTQKEVYIDFEVPLSRALPVKFENGRYIPLPDIKNYELSENLIKFFEFFPNENGDFDIVVDEVEENLTLISVITTEKTFSMPSIKYVSDRHVFRALEATLVGAPCSAHFDEITSRISLVLEPGVELKMSESLALFLGFGLKTSFAETTKAKTPVSINYRSNTVFVKCSIVSHSIVSHVLSRNLRVFPLENSEKSTMIHKTFLDKQYFSIDQDSVDSVHVSLLTELGEKLHLNDSAISTWVTLVFTKDDYVR